MRRLQELLSVPNPTQIEVSPPPMPAEKTTQQPMNLDFSETCVGEDRPDSD